MHVGRDAASARGRLRGRCSAGSGMSAVARSRSNALTSGNGEDVHRSGQCRPGSGADATRRRPLTRAARPRRWPATIRICIPPWSRHPSISKHTHRRLGNTHPTTSQDNKRPSAVCRESPTIGAFSDGAVGVADGVPTGRAACRDAALWTAPKRVIHTEQGRPEPCACVHWSSGGVAQLTRPLLLEASWLPGLCCSSGSTIYAVGVDGLPAISATSAFSLALRRVGQAGSSSVIGGKERLGLGAGASVTTLTLTFPRPFLPFCGLRLIPTRMISTPTTIKPTINRSSTGRPSRV